MASSLDLNNVQGDILSGLPKKTETFFLFRIDEARIHQFRAQLAKLVPLITTTSQVVKDRERIAQHKQGSSERRGDQEILKDKRGPPSLLGMSGVNLAFTRKGLQKMGINDDIGDSVFNAGMLADAQHLGDQGSSASGKFDPDWIPEFKQEIHGLIPVTAESRATVDKKLAMIKQMFSVGEKDATMHQVLSLVGDVRPGTQSGHEHFGFQDGISQPAVTGVDTKPNPGQETVRQGVILLGREGDESKATRPSWALDGSFLSFRYLHQRVPEFNAFLKQHPIPISDPNTPPSSGLGSELLGARLVGRWKSGAPIDVTPLKDDASLGGDASRNDNFRYDPQSSERCPFAAHTRKTNPRADLDKFGGTEKRRILRRGIQFGPEVSKDEAASNTTTQQRGLLFVAYQSNIANGFQFIQNSWANNENFIFGKPVPPGFDPIIGQTSNLAPRALSGTNPKEPDKGLDLSQQWVVTKGGEYFFSPSIPALKQTFALAA